MLDNVCSHWHYRPCIDKLISEADPGFSKVGFQSSVCPRHSITRCSAHYVVCICMLCVAEITND